MRRPSVSQVARSIACKALSLQATNTKTSLSDKTIKETRETSNLGRRHSKDVAKSAFSIFPQIDWSEK